MRAKRGTRRREYRVWVLSLIRIHTNLVNVATQESTINGTNLQSKSMMRRRKRRMRMKRRRRGVVDKEEQEREHERYRQRLLRVGLGTDSSTIKSSLVVARHRIKRIRISWKSRFKNESFVVLAVEASVLKVRNVEERDLVFTVTEEEMSPRSIRLSIVVSSGLYPWRTDRECTRSMRFYHVIPHLNVWKDLKVSV